VVRSVTRKPTAAPVGSRAGVNNSWPPTITECVITTWEDHRAHRDSTVTARWRYSVVENLLVRQ